MRLSSEAADRVLADYAARIEREAGQGVRVGGGPAGGQGLSRDDFLLAVGPEAGWFLHSLIMAHKPARILELGTSYGYSTLFLADAASTYGGKVVSIDVADYKQAEAARQLGAAGLSDSVEFRCGDAVSLIEADEGPWHFVLLDVWKDMYAPCLQAFYPKLADEAIVASDNMIRPESARPSVRVYREGLRALPDMQTVLLPVGSGIELSVKWSSGNDKL